MRYVIEVHHEESVGRNIYSRTVCARLVTCSLHMNETQ
jgi:hypothetical protein